MWQTRAPWHALRPLFKGRGAFLDQVRSMLQAGNVSAIVGAQDVHGMGGLGKTRPAIEYGLSHADEYSALLFVGADRPENLEKNLAEHCGPLVLNLPEQTVTEQQVRYTAAFRLLADHRGWFLILDNVDDEQSARAVEKLLLHLRNRHVLITSRFGDWSGSVERLDLEALTAADSIDLLRERTRSGPRIEPDDDVAVTELARELDGLPLALEQAGAFIEAKRESFARYLARWRKRVEKVRTWFDEVRMKYPRSVTVTWDTSFKQLDASSRALLNMLRWFAQDPIPVTVWQTPEADAAIASGARHLAPEMTPTDAEHARAGLSRIGLILWESDRFAFRVHWLMQEVTRERLDATTTTRSLQDALSVIDAYLPSDPPPQDIRSWLRWNPVRVHVAQLLYHADARPEQQGSSTTTTRLMNELGMLLTTKGNWSEAEPPCATRWPSTSSPTVPNTHVWPSTSTTSLSYFRPRTGWRRQNQWCAARWPSTSRPMETSTRMSPET